MSNGLDPDQDRHSVGSDLGRNCLKRLTVEDKSTLGNDKSCFSGYVAHEAYSFFIYKKEPLFEILRSAANLN